jgi:membrane protein implicated in regulation of membrane protease activity
MSADFISGLLLFGVLLFGAGYVIKEFFWESLSASMANRRAAAPSPPPRQPNDHLVGAIGRVIDDGTGSGMMRVRVGMETWRARSIDEGASLPVGAQVEVKAVDGLVLDVAARAAAVEQPST